MPRFELTQDPIKLRRGGYAEIGLDEQVGALVKAVTALIASGQVPDDALETLRQVEAVKSKFPKVPPKI